jgi:formiminoglutamase
MIMDRMPFFISVPHGGTETPEEVKDRICISHPDVLEDSDAFTREIYNLSDDIRYLLRADVARAFVDLNRAEDDLPPENPDGVVKSRTCYSKQIYIEDLEPDASLIEELLARYHRPYHAKIREVLGKAELGIILALDCHSMAAVGPDIAPDTGQRRPIICLGNRQGETCPNDMATLFAQCLRESFSLEEPDVTLNHPFGGGYITRTYGAKPIPWIQVEMSRVLFLRPPYFNETTWDMDRNRLNEINKCFRNGLRLLANRL